MRESDGDQVLSAPAPHRAHTHRSRIGVLDTFIDLGSGATKADLESAIAGHGIAETTLEGMFSP